MHKLVSILACLALVACGSSGSAPEPYVAAPLADLAPGTSLIVEGNHTGWWRNRDNPVGRDAVNDVGPKLQRLNITDTFDVYEAVFRNNLDGSEFNYGRAVFTMPATGGETTGTTDLGYDFRISRNNQGLVFTLTGIFHIKTNPGPTAGREAHGGYAAGSYTPENGLPTTGAATYTGEFIGFSSNVQELTGTFAMTATFGTITGAINGTIGNLTDAGGPAGISDLTITAVIDQVAGTYEGVVTSVTGTGVGDDFPAGTTGNLVGGFYGPTGEETAGTIRIDNAGHYITGAFGGDELP